MFDAGPGQAAADQAFNQQKRGLNQGFNQAKSYAGKARREINQGMDSAYGFIDQGTNQAAGEYGKALGNYDELYPGAVAGYNAYGDAFGLGGVEGYDRARENFQTGPGYEFMMNQGLDALDRRANSRGMLASGNNQIDTLNYATGLADQQWDDYTSGLSPYLNLAPQLAGAQGDLYSQLASLYSNQGTNKANIATGGAGQKAGINTGLGNTAYNTRVGIGQAGAENVQNQFAAEQGANQNLWGAITGLAGGLTGAAGQAGGFGKLFS